MWKEKERERERGARGKERKRDWLLLQDRLVFVVINVDAYWPQEK